MNPPRAEGPQRLMRTLVHAVANVFGWFLFFRFWVIVVGQPRATDDLWLLIVGSALLFPLVTIVWIAHNVSIFRRKGPRRAAALLPLDYAVDFNGRRIAADWAQLAGAHIVTIEVAGEVKRFVPAALRTWPAPEGRADHELGSDEVPRAAVREPLPTVSHE